MNNSNALNEAIREIAPLSKQLAVFEKDSPLFVGDLIDSLVAVVKNPSPENGKKVAADLATCKWSNPTVWDEVNPMDQERFGALAMAAVFLREPETFVSIMEKQLAA